MVRVTCSIVTQVWSSAIGRMEARSEREERKKGAYMSQPCLYFNQANVTPQIKKQKSHSMMSHYEINWIDQLPSSLMFGMTAR